MSAKTWHLWVCVLTLMTCGSAVAQNGKVVVLKEQPGRLVHLYVGGGVSFPVTALADQANAGPNATLAVGIIPRFISSGDIEVLLRGQFDRFPSQSDAHPDISFMSVGLDFKLNLGYNEKTNWYMIAGAGLTKTKWHEYTVGNVTRAEYTQNDQYGEAGLGVELIRKDVSPFIQLRFSDVTGKRMGNYYFVRLQAGLKI